MTRGIRRKLRQPADGYPTPEWCTRRLMENADFNGVGTWLEPAVGDGAILRIVRAYHPNVVWHTCDIRPTPPLCSVSHFDGDYLKLAPCVTIKYDCIITNPPFSMAMEFIQASLPIANNVVMLLRLGFLESSNRNAWIRHNMPSHIYVLPNRQGGTADGKTDVFTYGWFHWKPTWINGIIEPVTESVMVVLPNTDLEERRADRAKLATQAVVAEDV